MDVVGGQVFFQGRLQKACVGIEEGRIVKVKKVLQGEEHHDFGDLLVLPGAIDRTYTSESPGRPTKRISLPVRSQPSSAG